MEIPSVDNSYEAALNLLAVANELPHSAARVALCEEAVRQADALNDVGLGYHARHRLLEATLFGGRPDLTLVAFSWCVAQYDRNPEAFDSSELLWKFKWIAGTLPRFPQIDRPTIENMLNDMAERFAVAGISMQPVWLKRQEAALMMGDLDAAGDAHDRFGRLSRNFLSDCHACEVDSTVDYYFDLGKNSLGLKKAVKIFNGSLSCAEVPHRTHALVLLPLLKTAKAEEAMHHHQVGYPMVKGSAEFGRFVGMHIAFLALTGNDARALRLLEKHMPDALDGSDPYREFHFLRFCYLAIDQIGERKKKAKLRLPKLSEKIAGPGEYVLSDLAGELEIRARNIAGQFDHRNGNSYCTDLVRDTAKWKRCAVEFPCGKQ